MPMNQPSRSDVHVDRPLTEISIAFLQSADTFVADKAYPILPVSKQSDSYFTYDRGMFNRDEAEELAPGTRAAAANYTLSTDTYSAKVWALAKDIADQVRANADSPLSLDREATEFLVVKMLIRKERNFAANHFVTGKWTTERAGVASGVTGTQFLRWDVASSTPIEDVRAAIRAVQVLTGFRPDRIVLGRAVYDALLDHPDIIGRIDRGQTSGPAVAMKDSLAALFELKQILVMDAIYNSAAEGATNVHAFIGASNALLLYTPASPGLMTPSAGYTFAWSGLLGAGATGTRMLRFRMDPEHSDLIEIQMSFDQKLIAADLGYFFLDAVS
ncbi:hypothetical protein LCGC14_2409030 [marine sediment metagenome]|uniref:Bacteriophage Mu GpT domain-containing protein n=1 Tax=marine sediment metagenome TaxID=412755 RepID=A0A0F9CF58_9ZZZZ